MVYNNVYCGNVVETSIASKKGKQQHTVQINRILTELPGQLINRIPSRENTCFRFNAVLRQKINIE